MKSSQTITRAVRHQIPRSLNAGKGNFLKDLIQEYQKKVQFFIDWLWDNPYSFYIGEKEFFWDRQSNFLDCPGMIKRTSVPNCEEGMLSGRILSNAATQACGVVRGVINRKKKLEAKREWLISQRKSVRKIDKRLSREFGKPSVFHSHFKMEINSICSDLQLHCKSRGSFDSFLKIKSINRRLSKAEQQNQIAKQFESFIIPFKLTKQDHKFISDEFEMLNSFLISKDTIEIRYRKEVAFNSNELRVGIDTGINSSVSMSTGEQSTSDSHGHTLKSILQKKARQKPGSKAFARSNDHLKNFINWDIKRNFNWNAIGTIAYEKIKNMKFKRTSLKLIQGWSYPLIEKSILNQAELHGVRAIPQTSFYRSRRCSACGYTHRSNRKGESFICKSCGFQINADLNAAKNHSVVLSSFFGRCQWAKKPFFWKETGFFDFVGKELIVPSVKKRKLKKDI